MTDFDYIVLVVGDGMAYVKPFVVATEVTVKMTVASEM